MQNKRKKKIEPRKRIRILTITDDCYRLADGYNEFAPFIRLRGKWLKEIGFKSGQKIIVKISEKHLVIKPLPPKRGNYA